MVVAGLEAALEQRRNTISILETYVPRLVMGEVLRQGVGENPISSELEAVVAFVDMSGFSSLCSYLHVHSRNQGDITASTAFEVKRRGPPVQRRLAE